MMHDFGELRSILQTSSLSPKQVHHLWTLIQARSQKDMSSYLASWPKYINDHSHLLSGFSLGECHSIAHLEESIKLAPPAYFTLHLDDLDKLNELSSCASLEHVVALKIVGGEPFASPVERLFSSPHLTSLESLTFESVMFEGDEFVRILGLERPNLLSELTITKCDLFPGIMLTSNGLTHAPLESSPLLAGLRTLNLSHNLLLDDSIAHWLSHPDTHASCEELDLSHNLLSQSVLFALATSPKMSNLRMLNLCHNVLSYPCLDHEPAGPECYKALLTSPYLKRLTHLNLARNSAIPREFVELVERQPTFFPALKHFVYHDTSLVEGDLSQGAL